MPYAPALSIGSPDGIHPHSKFLAHHDLQARAQKAADLGAAAVVFYNDDPTASAPEPKLSPKIKPIGIPVVFGPFRRFDPEEAFALIEGAGVANAFLPPTAIKMMRAVERPRERYRLRLRTIGAAGERPPVACSR